MQFNKLIVKICNTIKIFFFFKRKLYPNFVSYKKSQLLSQISYTADCN